LKIWLADIQEQYKKSLYIDSFDDPDKFSNDIATQIGQFLLARKIVADRTARSQPSRATRPRMLGARI
jgi:hypothetical protein